MADITKSKIDKEMTITEAIELYKNITDMMNNDAKGFVSYFLRIAFENSPQNDGNNEETRKLAEAMMVAANEYERTKEEAFLRISVTFHKILEHVMTHPVNFNYAA